ncbi:MAG TPA: DUF2066 domain-containing protein [Steroidobacteraceae bacterium]|nr:DUF2066 domain-containing protein [Steroidobacteraceae bacterium]
MSRFLCLSLALLSTVFVLAPARAVTVSDLYETAQPVENSRDAAFVEALKTVLVRVSGQRDAPARVGAPVNDPRQYVQRFGFTADNVLEVGFDSTSVDRLLSSAGLPIWGRERPATVVMFGVEEAGGAWRWLAADTPAAERDAIAKVARERGLPLKWPVMDAQERAEASSDGPGLLQAAARYEANAVLLGRSRGGVVQWTLLSNDGAAQKTGGIEDGVHLTADTFAHVFATAAGSLGSVIVEVAGIANLDAYAATLNYLEGMTLVRGVALEQVAGDKMRFRLAVRGDATTLRRAIALDHRLVPTDGSDGTSAGDRLAFRYQP